MASSSWYLTGYSLSFFSNIPLLGRSFAWSLAAGNMHLKLLREYNALPEMIMIAISTITLNVWSALKAGDAREADLIPGWGKSPGGGNGNPLQYSYLGNPMDGEVRQATVRGVTRSQTQLSDPVCFFAISVYHLYHYHHEILCVSSGSRLTFCNPVDYSSPGSSVHEIFQARILEWVAMPSSRGTFPFRDWTCTSCIAGGFFTTGLPGKPIRTYI